MTTTTAEARLAQRFVEARSDPSLVVLEGFHAVKHAIRFGADIETLVTDDSDTVRDLAGRLATDMTGAIEAAQPISTGSFERMFPQPPPTRLAAIARRPRVSVDETLGVAGPEPMVVLDRPARLGNIGAVIRVAAAAGCAGVITIGRHDPWHPEAVRGAAGLQFAVPAVRADRLCETDRPVVAIDPAGESFSNVVPPPRATLVFGSERDGVSRDLLERASVSVSIPMRESVSSLNLATSVAVILYAWIRPATMVAPHREGR